MGQLHDIGRYMAPPEVQHLEALAREAYAEIPEGLRQALGDVVIRVLDFPDDETLEEMDCELPFDLLGLYRGVDLQCKSSLDAPDDLDMIYLYRRPILDYWCDSGEDLAEVVKHVLIHEIGHHFGFSDDDMDHIEHSA